MAVNRLRLAGHPDPVAGLDRLTLQDFDRLTFSPGELARLKLGAGELVLGLLRDGRADLEVEALGRSLVRPAQPAMLSDLAVALSSGTGRGRYSARKAQALALHFARTGRYWRSLDWLARAAWRHPWGPLGLAGGVARWLWTARHGKR
jgi:hypothetical protein